MIQFGWFLLNTITRPKNASIYHCSIASRIKYHHDYCICAWQNQLKEAITKEKQQKTIFTSKPIGLGHHLKIDEKKLNQGMLTKWAWYKS